MITSRELSPDLWIVSRASKKENISRLVNSGANKVISPEETGGTEIYFAAIERNLIKITAQHGVNDIKRETEIILKHGCSIENIEYHYPHLKKPLKRNLEISNSKQLDEFVESIASDSETKKTLENLYESVYGIHSHWISGPDRKTLDQLVKELKKKNLILGVNLTHDQIMEFTKKNSKMVEVILKPEIRIIENHPLDDIVKEAEIILKHNCVI